MDFPVGQPKHFDRSSVRRDGTKIKHSPVRMSRAVHCLLQCGTRCATPHRLDSFRDDLSYSLPLLDGFDLVEVDHGGRLSAMGGVRPLVIVEGDPLLVDTHSYSDDGRAYVTREVPGSASKTRRSQVWAKRGHRRVH